MPSPALTAFNSRLALLLTLSLAATPCLAQEPFTETLAVDINTDPGAGSLPLSGERVLDRLIFSAISEGVPRLLSTDGTFAGTQPAIGDQPTPPGAIPVTIATVDGGVFAFVTPNLNREIWFTDGTPASAVRITDAATGPQPYSFGELRPGVTLGNSVIVALSGADAIDRLYRLDATPLPSITPIFEGYSRLATTVGDLVLFEGTDSQTGRELWATDGTPEGTYIVADLVPGPTQSNVLEIEPATGGAYFTFTPTNPFFPDETLQFTTGEQGSAVTVPGTVDVFSEPRELTSLGAGLVLVADDFSLGNTTADVWATAAPDSTAFKLLDTDANSTAFLIDGPRELTRAGDSIFFRIDGGTFDRTMWITDGTIAGTTQIFQADELGLVGAYGGITPLGSGARVVFSADDGVHGRELWTTDGTLEGTRILSDSAAGPASSFPIPMERVGNTFYFSADDAVNGRELHAFSVSDAGGYVASPFGSSCGATLAPKGSAEIGAALDLDVVSSAPQALARLFISPGNGAIQVDECTVHLYRPLLFDSTTTDDDGFGSISIPLPDDPTLVGLTFQFQYIVNAPGGPLAGGFELTNGLEVVIGS